MVLRTAIAAACAWSVLSHAPDLRAADRPVTHTVVIEGLKFVPENLTVKRGDTVVWVNKDPYPHTATAKGVFDSESIVEGGSWRFTPRSAGEHPYLCTFHPNMKGKLQVR